MLIRILLVISLLITACTKTSLIVNDTNTQYVTKEWLKENNKALIYIYIYRDMNWKNITTNNPEDDIYIYNNHPLKGGYFFIATPGVYSLHSLEFRSRVRTYYFNQKITSKEQTPYLSFEAKAGEVLFLGHVDFHFEYQNGRYDRNTTKVSIAVNQSDGFLECMSKNIKNIDPKNIKKAKITEGINLPEFYHVD